MKSLEEHHVKITIGLVVTMILFIISITFAATTWKEDMENRIDSVDSRQEHLANKYVDTNNRITNLEVESTEVKVQLATINTKLSNIEVLLIDLKQDIKETRTHE